MAIVMPMSMTPCATISLWPWRRSVEPSTVRSHFRTVGPGLSLEHRSLEQLDVRGGRSSAPRPREDRRAGRLAGLDIHRLPGWPGSYLRCRNGVRDLGANREGPRRGVRLRLRSPQLPPLELGGSGGERDVGRRRPGVDLPDGAGASWRPRAKRAGDPRPQPPHRVRDKDHVRPDPFVYRYRFDSNGPTTVVHLAAEVELSGIAGALGPLGARVVRRGVDANFATLRHILEANG
jgi:hypothetical protein